MADGSVVISTALDNKGIEKGVKALKGTLGGLTKVTAKVSASIVAAFGTAAVAITKQASDAYADYEQLVGGVETLFKGGAEKVKGYAEDAFYRAGVSANKYMETVTSFSASLISALGGDTAKAADVADMAMVDMADNANKMGSAVESIQSAYQGFAKQNYTMLDNLKLGYGGTKTEMERLLTDAQAISGIKYDINNLSDVYSAIHEIQKKLGIAGATAQEAEKTIGGSANMTKAAWQNVLTAISGGGDLDKAINNLVFSISKYFENIVPVVERSLAGIGQMIEQVAPALVQTVAMALIKAIPSLIDAVYQMILGLAKGIHQGITALFAGENREIEAQIGQNPSGALGSVAEGYRDVKKSAEDAEKASKRYLAGFDQIQKIGGGDSASAASSGATIPATIVPVVGDQASSEAQGAMTGITDRIKELLRPLLEIDLSVAMGSFRRLAAVVKPLVEDVFSGLMWAYQELLVPLAAWAIEDALPRSLEWLRAAFDGLKSTAEALKPLAVWLWESFLKPLAAWTGGVVSQQLGATANRLWEVSDWISNNQALVEGMVIVIGSFATAWGVATLAMKGWNLATKAWNAIGPISAAVTTAFGTAVNFLTSPITLVTLAIGALIAVVVLLVKNWDTVKAFAVKAWDGIKAVWSTVAEWFRTHVTEPIGNFFKGMVNAVIWYINSYVGLLAKVVNTIIGIINKIKIDVPDWVPGIGGETIGFNIPSINAPKIPYLAQGAVLPANKPFLAMVGDQRHGTNVEAPLATIQEAVANVMGDMLPAMMAGFEAVVEEQRSLRSCVEHIEIGDDVIGQAARRYDRKMTMIRGV